MKAKKLISWKVLDRYKTSRGIAAFLRKHKITGIPDNPVLCPLAIATGYKVDSFERSKSLVITNLTDAEMVFVTEFDLHIYPDLERK